MAGSPSRQPQPVILDTDLEFPLETSKLMGHDLKPWIFCRTGLESNQRKLAFEAAGIRVFHATLDQYTGLLSLEDVLQCLYDDLDIQKLVVEGGVTVLENFIRLKLFDKLVVIQAPCFGVGRALFQAHVGEGEALRAELPRLTNIRYDVLGTDLIMSAEPI